MAQLAVPFSREADRAALSHSLSFDHRLQPETLQKSGLRPGGAIAVLLAAIQGIVREEVAPHEYTRAVAAIAHVLRLFATHRQNEKEAA